MPPSRELSIARLLIERAPETLDRMLEERELATFGLLLASRDLRFATGILDLATADRELEILVLETLETLDLSLETGDLALPALGLETFDRTLETGSRELEDLNLDTLLIGLGARLATLGLEAGNREPETRDRELDTGNRELPAAGLTALLAALAATLGLLDETEVSSRDRDLWSRELAGLTFLLLGPTCLFPLMLSPKKPDGHSRLWKCIPR